MKKLVDKDPFSNGTEFMVWEERNCDKCIKSSQPKDDFRYTNADENMMPKCSIQRDIVTRMFCNDPIKQETVDICKEFVLHGTLCPYMKTERKKYTKKVNNQTTLNI